MLKRLALALIVGLGLGATLSAQDTLSAQVLRLLTRVNAWTATNTFLDLRLIQGVPSDTALRFYVDNTGNLYFNGNLVAGSSGGGSPHNLLSTTHPDTLPASVTRGALIVGNGTPAWARLTLGGAGTMLCSDGTDATWCTNGASLTSLSASALVGSLPAISGAALTSLNASALSSGTVPTSTLTGVITDAEVNASAAIAYSKLNLAASVKLASDVTGTLPLANGGLGLSSAADDTIPVSSGSAWVATAVPNCVDATHALAYTASTNAFSCQALTVGSGTATSVGLSLPAIFSVSGSPVTTSGTLTAALATQSANLVWAGPTTGSAASPTFRALVNADLPLTGVSAGAYPKVTVNTAGVVTAASTTIAAATDVSGTLPRANGGTGVAVSADDSVLVGSGTAWVATSLPDCQGGTFGYTQSTNLFSCVVSVAAGTAGTGTLGTTTLPFASVVIGTAATNNLAITPAAFSQATTATVDDPKLTAVKLPLVRRGTIAYTGSSLATGTCDTAVTATITGLLTTSVVTASLNAAPGTQWQKGIYFLAYPTADTVNIRVCNPTAGSITPDNVTFNYAVTVP